MIAFIALPNKAGALDAYGGSPFGHPAVGANATHYINYARDPSSDKTMRYVFFDNEARADARAQALRKEGYCVGGPWRRPGLGPVPTISVPPYGDPHNFTTIADRAKCYAEAELSVAWEIAKAVVREEVVKYTPLQVAYFCQQVSSHLPVRKIPMTLTVLTNRLKDYLEGGK